MDLTQDNINNDEYEKILAKYNELEKKSLLYKLKRWEIALMKKLRTIISKFNFFKDYNIEKQNEELNEKIKKEMEELNKETKKIEQEKEESIKKLEIEKQNLIKANDQKYVEILDYLNTIKNDKDKLIEFLNKKNLF